MSDEQQSPATTPEAPKEGAETVALPAEGAPAPEAPKEAETAPAPAPEAPKEAETAPAPAPEVAKEPEAATAPEELRQDGPTLEEYVAAGYPADKYPPEGYAARESAPKADDEAQPTRHSKRTAA